MAPGAEASPFKQARAASTAMVTASSSQLHMARSPLALPAKLGSAQTWASTMAWRAKRSLGT